MEEHWLHFHLGPRRYAIPLAATTEVVPESPLRLIPFVPLEIGGVLNVRGEPVPVLNGVALLQGDPETCYGHILLLERGPLRLGLRVGHVSRIEPVPQTPADDAVAREAQLPFVHWVRAGKRLIGLIHPGGLLECATELLTRTRPSKSGQEDLCQSA